MARRVMNRPPQVKQGTGYKCWAAALQSWLTVTPDRPQWTQEQLLASSQMFLGPYKDHLPEGAINADIFKKMAGDDMLSLRMSWEEIPANQGPADDYMYQTLSVNGYLLVMYTVDPQISNVRHGVVVWAADDDGNLAVMNPTKGAYVNVPTTDLYVPMLVAYASTPLW
jgi:hypothetical protein